MDSYWYYYILYNHIKHFWKNAVVDRLNRHGIHLIQFSDERIKKYAGKTVMSQGELNCSIGDLIDSGKPFLVSRLSGCETKYSTMYLKKNVVGKVNAAKELCTNAGFFPNKISECDKYAELYIGCIGKIDICCVWRYFMEDYLLYRYAPATKLSILEWLEPWRFNNDKEKPWSSHLRGKKVLIVHPFAESIISQYEKHRRDIFRNVVSGKLISIDLGI